MDCQLARYKKMIYDLERPPGRQREEWALGQPTDHSGRCERTENPSSQFPFSYYKQVIFIFIFMAPFPSFYFLKHTEYIESKMIVQNNLLFVFDRNIRFGTVTKNNCFYKNGCISVISSCV